MFAVNKAMIIYLHALRISLLFLVDFLIKLNYTIDCHYRPFLSTPFKTKRPSERRKVQNFPIEKTADEAFPIVQVLALYNVESNNTQPP